MRTVPRGVKYPPGQYNRASLQILHYLRRCGGTIEGNVLNQIVNAIGSTHPIVSQNLINLEKQSVVIRTKDPRPKTSPRWLPLIKVEMVDSNMWLPPIPPPLPQPVVVAIENEILLEATAHEPTTDDIMEALADRLEELLRQIDKLQGIIETLNEENRLLKHRVQEQKRERPAHLTQKLQSVLTPDKWEELRHR